MATSWNPWRSLRCLRRDDHRHHSEGRTPLIGHFAELRAESPGGSAVSERDRHVGALQDPSRAVVRPTALPVRLVVKPLPHDAGHELGLFHESHRAIETPTDPSAGRRADPKPRRTAARPWRAPLLAVGRKTASIHPPSRLAHSVGQQPSHPDHTLTQPRDRHVLGVFEGQSKGHRGAALSKSSASRSRLQASQSTPASESSIRTVSTSQAYGRSKLCRSDPPALDRHLGAPQSSGPLSAPTGH
jgi:hypothetical protein